MRTAIVMGWAMVVGLASQLAFGQTSYPMLMSIHPVAAQQGQTTEHEIDARYNLYGAYQVFVTGPGVTGEIIPPEAKPDPKTPDKKPTVGKLKVKFTVAADAPAGVREVRLATPFGMSTVAQLVIGRDPVVVETPDNDSREKAQAITLPANVCGTVEKAEDIDWYKFSVEAGKTLTFHVRCNRLQNKIHDLQDHCDPIITIRNASGVTLATGDNEFFADPALAYRFEQAGEYFLEIRDVRYLGNPYWKYSLEINDRPLVTQVYPLGLVKGSEQKVELVGLHLPDSPMSQITVPMEIPEGPMNVGLPMGDQLSNPVTLFASSLPVTLEGVEDNNSFDKAQAVTFPGGVSGRIETPADIDCYAFEAKKGDVFSIEVQARRLQSGLDSIVRILNDKGQPQLENDDAQIGRLNQSDSYIESWTAPADGKFILEIRDLHLRGGKEFVYFLKVTRPVPGYELFLDSDKTIVTPGTNSTIFVRARRMHGFAGDIDLHIENLPPGVTARVGKILATGTDGCIILQGAPDAKLAAGIVRIHGTATHQQGDQKLEMDVEARPLEEIYMPGGGRHHFPVDVHAVSVAEPLDLLSVKLSETDITLKPGETKKIDVTLVRAPGYTQNVTLDVIYRHLGSIFGDSLPKGVTLDEAASQTLLQAGATQGSIVLKAAADAQPVEKQLISVMAHISINFVMKTTYTADPLTVTVVK